MNREAMAGIGVRHSKRWKPWSFPLMFTTAILQLSCDSADSNEALVLSQVRAVNADGDVLDGFTLSAPQTIQIRDQSLPELASAGLAREVYVLAGTEADPVCRPFGTVDDSRELIPERSVLTALESRAGESITLIARWLAGPEDDRVLLATASYPFTVGEVEDNVLVLDHDGGTPAGLATSTGILGESFDVLPECPLRPAGATAHEYALDADGDELDSIAELNSRLGVAGATSPDVPSPDGAVPESTSLVVVRGDVALGEPLPATWALDELYALSVTEEAGPAGSSSESLDARLAADESDLYIDVLVPASLIAAESEVRLSASLDGIEIEMCPPPFSDPNSASPIAGSVGPGVFVDEGTPDTLLFRCTSPVAETAALDVRVELLSNEPPGPDDDPAQPATPTIVWGRPDVLVVHTPMLVPG